MRTKAQQLEGIRADQQFWRDLAAEVGPERYGEPGAMGDWTFGDLAGHLLGWRNRTIARLEAIPRGEPDPYPEEIEEDDAVDRMNEWFRDNDAGRSPAELVAAYDDSYDRLIRALEALPEETLTDPNALQWVGRPLVEVAFTGHLHEEHVPAVRAWLDGSAATAR